LCLLNRSGKTVLMATHDYALISKHKARSLICEGKRLVDASRSEGKLDFAELL